MNSIRKKTTFYYQNSLNNNKFTLKTTKNNYYKQNIDKNWRLKNASASAWKNLWDLVSQVELNLFRFYMPFVQMNI